MKSRIAAGLLVLGLAGCANEPVASPVDGQMYRLGAIVVTPEDLAGDRDGARSQPKKTVASKVLSAIAFERVTGFKVDPARLLQTD